VFATGINLSAACSSFLQKAPQRDPRPRAPLFPTCTFTGYILSVLCQRPSKRTLRVCAPPKQAAVKPLLFPEHHLRQCAGMCLSKSIVSDTVGQLRDESDSAGSVPQCAVVVTAHRGWATQNCRPYRALRATATTALVGTDHADQVKISARAASARPGLQRPLPEISA